MARTMPDEDKDRGLYAKYDVRKRNGKPVGECFVLEEHDPHAPETLLAYAAACEKEYPLLADDLRVMADRWVFNQGLTA